MTGRRGERGSATLIETIILVPFLMLVVMLIVFCGRMMNAKAAVDGAARDGARAASIARIEGNASGEAQAAASASLNSIAGGSTCASSSTTAFWVGPPENRVATAVVTCSVSVADLTMLPVGGSRTITATYSAPVDEFRSSP